MIYLFYKMGQRPSCFKSNYDLLVDLIERHNKVLTDLAECYQDLTLELERIKSSVEESKKPRTKIKKKVPKNKNRKQKSTGLSDTTGLSDESYQAISHFVEQLLADRNINIAYLPDAVERQIYLNVFSLLVGLLNQTVQKNQIEFLGHRFKLEMKTSDTY